MNGSEKRSLEETMSQFFGDGPQPVDDVSIESANRAGKVQPKKTRKVKVFDTELGWVDEYVTEDAPTVDETGTLRETVRQYGATFPDTMVVTFTYWGGKKRIMAVEGDIERGSVDIILEDGSSTTFNPLQEVTIG